MIQQATNQLGQTITGSALTIGYALGQTPMALARKEVKTEETAEEIREKRKQEVKAEEKIKREVNEELDLENKIKEIETKRKIIGDIGVDSDQLLGDIYDEQRDLEVELAKKYPTEERLKRASEVYSEREDERVGQARINEVNRTAREAELARQTIQETILRGGYETANSQQTMKYQEALELMRNPETQKALEEYKKAEEGRKKLEEYRKKKQGGNK